MDRLTEYEQERRPQEITLDSEITISPRSLSREIICPICMDVLSQTRAAPDCLHRFCKKCLEKAVKNKCPVCKEKLPSQVKGFMEDPKFDQLIMKIQNAHQAKPVETTKGIHAPECEIVLKQLNGKQTRYLKCPENTTVDHLTRYLSIRPDGPKMPDLHNNEEYKLLISADRAKGHYKLLSGALKLDEIKNSYNLNSDKPMEFYFYNPG